VGNNNEWEELPADEWEEIPEETVAPKDTGSAIDTVGDFLAAQREGFPGSGLISKAAAGTNAAVSSLLDIVSGRPGKSYGEHYDDWRAEQRADTARREGRSPAVSTAGSVTGGFMAPAAKGNAVVSGLANTAIAAADEMAKADSLEEAAIRGKQAAAVSGVLNAIPVAAKVKRLLPGTEDALPIVNKVTAKAASLLPNQSATSDEIYDLFANPSLRRQARNADLDKTAAALTSTMTKAKDAIDDRVGTKFDQLEQQSLKARPMELPVNQPSQGQIVLGADADAASRFLARLSEGKKAVDENKQFFGPMATKMFDDVQEIMTRGGPGELGRPQYGKAIEEIGSAGENLVAKQRALLARRHIDDMMRNKDFQSLSKYEKEAVGRLRDQLQGVLKGEMTGAGDRAMADALYADKSKTTKNFFSPLTTKNPDKTRELDPVKVAGSLKSRTAKGGVFDKRAQELEEFLKANKGNLGVIPEAEEMLKGIKDARELGRMKSLIEHMKRAGGGPTSQAVQMIGQAGAAAATGGKSLLALPVTNPSGYARSVDAGAELLKQVANTRFAKVLGEAAKRGNKSLAATHAILLNDPEYQAIIKQQEQEQVP
jgi:hypothetical protein